MKEVIQKVTTLRGLAVTLNLMHPNNPEFTKQLMKAEIEKVSKQLSFFQQLFFFEEIFRQSLVSLFTKKS